VKFLADSNLLSEPTKPAPEPRVIEWLRHHEHELALSPIVLGELEYGILLLPSGRRRSRLREWFNRRIERMQVLNFDADTASEWARLLARLKNKSLAMSVKDSLIAASALVHGLTVATRNTKDFRNAGVALVNPFEAFPNTS